jgi:hypothetical protein
LPLKPGGGVVEEQPKKKKRGPGAPPGNTNALKHGRHSQQFAMLGALLASDSHLRGVLLGLGRRNKLKEEHAQEIAARLLTGIIEHANKKSGGALNSTTQTDDFKSTRAAGAKIDPATYNLQKISRRKSKNNSPSGTRPENQLPGPLQPDTK